MSEGSVERSAIRVDAIKGGRRNVRLRFALVSTSGQVILSSEEFKSTNPPKNGSEERAALDRMLQVIRGQGWEIIARASEPEQWWAFQFARGDQQSVERERQWSQLAAPAAHASSTPAPQREVVFVEKKRGCLGGCLSGVGAIVLGIVGLIAVIVVAAVAINDGSSGNPNDNGNGEAKVNDQGTPEAVKVGSGENPAPIGASVTGDGLEVTVHSAELSDTAGVLAGAEPGVLYLTLDVTIRNVSEDKKSFNALYWSGKDIVNGYAFDDDLFAGDSMNQLPSGDLQPSDLIRGEVVIKVRADSQKIRIKYDTAPIGGTNLYWLFQAP